MTSTPMLEATPARLPVADARRMWRTVLRLSRGRRTAVVVVLVLLLAAAASTLVLPLTIGWMVDTVGGHDGAGIPSVLWWQAGAIAAAAVLGGGLELAGAVALGRVIDTMAAELREEFVAAALDLPPAEVERVGIGDIVTRAATDTRNVSDELPGILPTVATTVFSIVLIGVGTAAIDWRFTLAFALAVPLYVRALRWYLPAVPPVYAAVRSADSNRGQQVLTTLTALPTVTAFGAGPKRLASVQAATWQVARWLVRARIMQNRFFGRINLAEAVGLILVISCGFWLATTSDVSLGAVTAAALLYLQLTGPLASLMFVMDDLQSAASSLGRVVGVVEQAPRRVSDRRPSDDAAVRLDQVGFGYQEGHPVVTDIDLTVGHGEHLALVGTTGSGKTTVARLVAGSREPTAGAVTTSMDPRGIAFLDQEAHVFAGTVRDNLRLAAPDADDDRLREALGTVDASHLAALPGGLDARLGDEGHRLDGSDAQLLSLARLVLRDPELAILDEATADADSRNAAALERATARAIDGRSAIVIAHRLSQAAACDRIVVLEHGSIVEQGHHDDLLARGGRYAELWAVYDRP